MTAHKRWLTRGRQRPGVGGAVGNCRAQASRQLRDAARRGAKLGSDSVPLGRGTELRDPCFGDHVIQVTVHALSVSRESMTASLRSGPRVHIGRAT